ncbi:MAG: metallophosphoesterase, partial [Elusimicrobia bacterium]|nr:metallophosphoesterase [Elusimicrobiota bacterium]
GDLIESQRQPRELYRFFTSKETKERIKNAGMNVSDKDLEEAFAIMEKVLNIMLTQINDTEDALTIQEDIQSFGFRERFKLLKEQISSFFNNKARTFTKTMVVSDIHGGYARFAELIVTLLDPKLDLSEKTDREIDDIIIDRLQNMGNNIYFYLLGDLLDRGSRQVETFELVKRISETGRMKYVVGNHDLYAFMNILGLHLPFYKNYKGIPDNYIDFQGRNIKALLEKLQSEDRRFLSSFNLGKEEPLSKAFWAAQLDYYMKYAEEEQKKWGITEKELQENFEKTFGFKLDSKGKDVLNNTSIALKSANTPDDIKAMFSDQQFINFHKKFFGRNVGIVVYTGIRAVNKMSINWWLDREKELEYLKEKYPQYIEYWQTMSKTLESIISQQEQKYEYELREKNISWAVIDAIMYRNYESTEWNALDWVYHKNWGGGEKGFIAQRNAQLEEKGKHKINRISYFDDSIIQEMLNFYQQNFYLYRFDNYGICYMHSMLPVDDDGDVSIGYVDENGIFHEKDSNGKRIKGFIYKGIQYKGKNIFKGLSKIAEDIRKYDASSNNLSEIMEALTLLTAIYADNTTRIKPANLKEMRAKFGFNKILKQKGITTIVVGHNPVTKLDNQFEYATLRFFNKEFKIINVVQIDGNMSPEYAPPKGAGLVRFIGGGITTRGFISGESTEITSSATPDVSREIFINSIILNIFPKLKDVLLFTEKIYNGFSYLKQRLSFGNIKINKRNTTIIDILQTKEEIQSIAEAEHIKGIKNIVIVPNETSKGITTIDDNNQQVLKEKIDIDGVLVNIEIKTNKIKVAKGYIPIISYSFTYDKNDSIIDEQTIENKIIEYIIDQINKKVLDIKTTKNMCVNSSINGIFESISIPKSIRNIFGPVLYDTKSKKSVNIIENISNDINIDKIKDILSAA